MTYDEITAKIKQDLQEYENNQGFFDIPMEWPFDGEIDVNRVTEILSAPNIDKAVDDLFYEMLESYFFSDSFSPSKEEIIVGKFITPETTRIILENGYKLSEFIADWVNFKVDDSVFRTQLSKYEPIKQSLEERIKAAERNRGAGHEGKEPIITEKKKFYYKLSDLNEIEARFLKKEGYKCLHKVRLYTEEEYKLSSEKKLLWPVQKYDDISEEKDKFIDVADAYKALIKFVQDNIQLENIDFNK